MPPGCSYNMEARMEGVIPWTSVGACELHPKSIGMLPLWHLSPLCKELVNAFLFWIRTDGQADCVLMQLLYRLFRPQGGGNRAPEPEALSQKRRRRRMRSPGCPRGGSCAESFSVCMKKGIFSCKNMLQ